MRTLLIFMLIATSGCLSILFIAVWIFRGFDCAWEVFGRFVDDIEKTIEGERS